MDDLIALRCPSCGGNLQVENDLQKIFCTHCGTQLLLKKGADGLLVPLQARDLDASARMHETEAAIIMMTALKQQIAELLAQLHRVRLAFWEQVMQGGIKKTPVGHIYSETDAIRRINDYTLAAAGVKAIILFKDQLSNDNNYAADKLARSTVPGVTTAAELLAFYQHIMQPQGYDQNAYRLATALYPVTTIAPALHEKQHKLEQVADALFEEFVQGGGQHG